MGRQILEPVSTTAQTRSAAWKWWVCGLLLFASMINYMDRQTLANAAVRITTQFGLKQEQYGNLELVFGWAFAVGSVVFGIWVDRASVRWVYPIVLVLWSATGFATGLVESYDGLLICRTLLGLFEAGHWPCAIKTTQRLLDPKDRAMGNSLLQSGASVGAILTPLVMKPMLTDQLQSWRTPFLVIGSIGVVWIIFWFAMVRGTDVLLTGPKAAPPNSRSSDSSANWRVLLSRRMLAVLFMVACINTCWQTLRAWLPKFLMEGRGYIETAALNFNSLYYVATDVGCLGAGALTLWLARRGVSVHRARLLVFLSCASLTALTTVVSVLPKGWPLLVVLLIVGAGALGVFPVYHALTQELSPYHQGKVTGLAGVAAWAFSSPAQKFFGRFVDRTGSFDAGFTLIGWLPLLALVPLWLLWGKTNKNE